MTFAEHAERTARARLAPAVFDYFAGGAGEERTLRENVQAWRSLRLRRRVGASAKAPETSIELLGERLELPIALAPVAAQRLLDPEGELAAARAARRAGTVYCLSTRATADLAEVAAVGAAPRWFQLYVQVARERSEGALRRAASAGYAAIVLTADLPVAGRRERELRHGPVALPDGVAMATHLGEDAAVSHKPEVGGWDPTLSFADIEWVAQVSRLPVLVKGLLVGEDAELAIEHGAAAVIVSNHGGRQLDGVLPTAHALPGVVAAVAGRVPVLVDGGVRGGVDVFRAIALGADAVLIGRPCAWALAAGGEEGVVGLLAALRDELKEAMTACGCGSVAAIGAHSLAGAT